MLRMLAQDVDSLATYIDKNLGTEIYNKVLTKEDMENDYYQTAHSMLDAIRTISKIEYLYTAIIQPNGDLVYHIDGLPYSDEDFRNVGDLIEEDFKKPLLAALSGEIVLPEDILKTKWGIVYVSYYPIHDKQGNTVAALGMEFSAYRQYEAYRNIRILVFVVIIVLSIASGVTSRYLFKRISNPNFKDHYNSDSLTQLKNRFAFDLDISNAINRSQFDKKIFIITDLNGLKAVNDKFGHEMGDFYVKSCAKALSVDSMPECIVYRIGGDEFFTIMPSSYKSKIDFYIESVRTKVKELCESQIPRASVSMGYSVCSGSTRADWEDAFKLADENMYQNKRSFYAKNKEMDKRRN